MCKKTALWTLTRVTSPATPSLSVKRNLKILIGIIAGISVVGIASSASATTAKTLIDFFQPMPIMGAKLSTTAWGTKTVGPRDQSNGLEDTMNKSYSYWDGKIFKATDGKFHLFGSHWPESSGHNGWKSAQAVHATSDNVMGPYTDKGLAWPNDQSGKGHNVTGITLADGTYVLMCSATRPATLFTSKVLDGPWTLLGAIVWNGAPPQSNNNTTILQKPTGDFMITDRDGFLCTGTKLIGPYSGLSFTTTYAQEPSGSVYAKISGSGGNSYNEDPVLWYSGGYYHVTYNYWGVRKAYHLMSKDSKTNWKLMGIAHDPTTNFLRYTDGTINHWFKIERPGVFIQNGHITHWTMSVIDVDKGEIVAGSGHNSKILIVPFDGVAFDNYFGDPTASKEIAEKLRETGERHSISMQNGMYTVNYSANAIGKAEFRLCSINGKQLALKRVALSQKTGSFSWEEVNALPSGIYSIYMKVNNGTSVENSFMKY